MGWRKNNSSPIQALERQLADAQGSEGDVSYVDQGINTPIDHERAIATWLTTNIGRVI
jgi:hypothetical protein